MATSKSSSWRKGLNVPSSYKPKGGGPTEYPVFLSRDEIEMVKRHTDGASTPTRFGIPSFESFYGYSTPTATTYGGSTATKSSADLGKGGSYVTSKSYTSSPSSASMGKGGSYEPAKTYTSSPSSASLGKGGSFSISGESSGYKPSPSSASLGKGGSYMPSSYSGGGGFAVNPKGSLGPTRGLGSGYGLESSFRLPSYNGNMAYPIQTSNANRQSITSVPGGYRAQAFGMATPSQLPRPSVSQPQTMHPVNSAWKVSDTGPIMPAPVIGGRALLANGSSLGPTRGNGSNYGLDSEFRLPSYNGNVAGPATPAPPSITSTYKSYISPAYKEYYDRIEPEPEPTYRSQAYNANVIDMAKNYGAYRSPSNIAPTQFADKTAGYQSAIDAARAAQEQSYPVDYRISPSSYSQPAPVHPEWQTDADESMGRNELPNYGLGTAIDKISRPISVAGISASPSRPPVSTEHPYGDMGVVQPVNRFPNFGQDVHFGSDRQSASNDHTNSLLTTPIGNTGHTGNNGTRPPRTTMPRVRQPQALPVAPAPAPAISQPTQSTIHTRNLIRRSIMQNKRRRSHSHTAGQSR